jgi:hypothetical protein
VPDVTGICGRCARELHGLDDEELCLFCEGLLCVDCWESWGYCPHPGADEWQARMKAAATEAQRRVLFRELGPIGTRRPIMN